MDVAAHILVFVLGAALVATTLLSALRTTVLPRGIPTVLSRGVFLSIRKVFRLFAGPKAPYERRDRVMAYYAPIGLFGMLVTWLVLVYLGYTAMFWAIGVTARESLFASGSSLFTLGFSEPETVRTTILVFTEAGIGLMLLALLISFMPGLYSAYSRRELPVTKLAVRSGFPMSGVHMLVRAAELGWILKPDAIAPRWIEYQDWFADMAETHQSFPALTFFRSPQPDRSWITAAGAVLDGAALRGSVVDGPEDLEANFCLRIGILALHEIAHFFRMPHEHDVEHPDSDHISISRAEFEVACDQMQAAGIPLRPRDEAWTSFAALRAEYDTALILLCRLVDAPEAAWSSDRDRSEWKQKLNPRGRGHVHDHERPTAASVEEPAG